MTKDYTARQSDAVPRSRRSGFAGKAAHRYAHSFFLMMKGKNRVSESHDELLAVLDFIKTHPEFSRLLLTTTISDAEKDGLIENFLGNDSGSFGAKEIASTETRNFIKLLIKKNRFVLFERIVEVVHQLFNTERGIEEVTLVTAFPTKKDLSEKLREVLEKKLKKQVLISTRTDPTILGGAVVYTRGEIIDGSLREKLRGLKQALLAGAV